MNAHQLQHTATVLQQLLDFARPADAVLSAYFRAHPKLGRQDRHEIAETAFAALRHWQKIQALLPQAARDGRRSALAALALGRGIGIGRLDWLPPEEAAWLAGIKAAKAALPATPEQMAELPAWLVATLQDQGWSMDEVVAFGRSVAQPAALDLRVNTLKARRDNVLAQLQAEGLAAEATPYSPWGIRLHDKSALARHPLFAEGSVEVQDEGSQLLALLTGARRGEMVVDFCAGAGGKTLALGAMMANSGRLYAFDVAEKRLANLRPRMVRAGLTNIHPQRIADEQDARLARLAGKADRVLVDAPCSGMGTLRRNPDLKYRQSPERVAALTEQQARILQAAAALVRPGGVLVYATCSVLDAENRQQVARFLQAQPGWRLQPFAVAGLAADDGCLQLHTAQHHTDGFFAALLQRAA